LKFQKPTRKTVLKYSVISVLSVAGFALYTNDHTPPVLTGFSFQANPDEAGRYDFSGRITDERGTSKAYFRCMAEDKEQFVLNVAMSGSNRNQVSFGVISRSPHWAGNWKGTSYDLYFQGQTNLPVGSEPNCQWQVELVDSLGNQKVEEIK
jgi:hypothetical protein